MKSRMQERYRGEVIPALMKRFNYTNPMAVPKIAKIVVNIGMGEASQNVKLLDVAVIELGHTRQALAQSVHPDDIGVHLADAHGQGIDLFLQDMLKGFELRLLPQQVGRPITQLIDKIGGTVTRP